MKALRQYDDTRPRVIRRVLFALLILLAALLQNTASGIESSLSVKPLLVLPAAVAISMFEREVAAALFGALGGAILDVSSANDGFNTLVLIVLCAACSLLISHLMRNNFITGTVLCAASLLLYGLAYIIVFNFAEGVFPLKAFFTVYIPVFAASLVAFPVLYYIVKAVYGRFNTAEGLRD